MGGLFVGVVNGVASARRGVPWNVGLRALDVGAKGALRLRPNPTYGGWFKACPVVCRQDEVAEP